MSPILRPLEAERALASAFEQASQKGSESFVLVPVLARLGAAVATEDAGGAFLSPQIGM
jgi:hypothetical protein